MARSIATIQEAIIAEVQADSTLSSLLTSTSVTAIWRLWIYVVAVAIWTMEVLFDAFQAEAAELVANEKPHTLRWYRQKAIDFQLGGTLIPGEDEYDNTALTPDEVAAQKIVTQAAAVEAPNLLIVKVARTVSGSTAPLTSPQITACTAYLNEIKDAGVNLQVRSVNADHLKVNADIYYDATILAADGSRLDGTAATPIQDAVAAFLKNTPFDGVFVKAHLTDAMQAVQGVNVPEIRVCQARRDDDPTYSSVDVFYEPFSGFLKIYDPSDLVLNFIPS